MGVSRADVANTDISSLVLPVDNLECLSKEFSVEEIDGVVKHLKVDKAPGPDGFNGMFVKKCWHIIKEDFIKLCFDFHKGQTPLESINGSYITLIPKKATPETVNDFRPISLTNTCLKFLTKLAANRLQKEIQRCIHANQYGFIKSRTIHDCLAWTFEYIYQCQVSKKQNIVLKLDFEKAFDTIEHRALIKIMEALGFDNIFIGWVREILSSGSSSILLNGIPGKHFLCKRGVRQGDPLSPLLYVLGGDLLQCFINKAHRDGRLKLPIPSRGSDDFPIVQYADDTIIILQADAGQVQILKEILEEYSGFTGLKINYHKSSMVPINMQQDDAQTLSSLIGCNIASMPFTYLGLPMGTTKPTIRDLAPLADRIERRLTATAMFLSYGDRLVLVNSVLSSMPIHYLCTLDIPDGLIDVIDKARRNCLWRKKKDDEKAHSLASWDMVCRPKDKGGLGIINLKIQNKCLLLKHLHNFYNNADLPWVKLIKNSYYYNEVPHAVSTCGSFWWRNIMKLSDMYRNLSTCKVGNGTTCFFWTDRWNDKSLSEAYPRLFSYVKDKLCSVKTAMEIHDPNEAFFLPLSFEAANELQSLQSQLHDKALSDSDDVWSISCSQTGLCIPSKIYKLAFQHIPNHFLSQWIWKSKCMSKHKFFAWLILHDRLNTKDMLLRRNWNVTNNNNCVLCPGQHYEDWSHLFFECMFSVRVWSYLQINWIGGSGPEMMKRAKKNFHGPCFIEIVILACWNLWKQRNNKIFRGIKPSFRAWRAGFISDITLVKHRVKKDSVIFLSSWIDNLCTR